MNIIRLELDYQFYYDIPSCNNSGWLCLLCNSHLDVVIEFSYKYIIRAKIQTANVTTWNASFFYESPHRSSKVESWDNLNNTRNGITLSIVIGDLNVILDQSDKQDGKPFDLHEAPFAKEIIHNKGLIDIEFSGNHFTWTNGMKGKSNIKQRLDKCLINVEWMLMYPNSKLVHLPIVQSYRCLILFNTPPPDTAKSP